MSLPSGRSDIIGDSETLQRAIISKSQFTRTKRRVKPALLSPNPHVELSVSRIEGLTPLQTRELADEVARKRGKNASLGYGEILPIGVREIGLEVEPDEPPLHHANITDWPSDKDPDEQRRRQLQVVKALVEKVQLKLWDEEETTSL